MTLRAHALSLFPALWLVLGVGTGLALLLHPGLWSGLALVFVLYLLPLLCYRLHELAWPLRAGLSRLDAPGYSPWWGGHQLQLVYTAFPALEALLRLVPGLYSLWLRGWGSRIGHGVHWTPRVEISDRALLQVGNGVVFGHRVGCYAHVVIRRRGALLLYVKPVCVGDGALLGAGSRLGPGARIAAGMQLPVLTDVGVGRQVRAEAGASSKGMDRAA